MKESIAAASGTFLLGDKKVHRIGFGAMRLTGKGIWGEPADPKEAVAVLKRAIDLGINFIDTADSYGPEVSENYIAKALYPYPSDLLIATKGGLTRQGPNRWTPLGRPDYLIQCIEMSLRRLKVDCIDLYQLHAIDPKVPFEESLRALKEMQKQGKIRHIGLSNFSIPDIERTRQIVNIVSIQNQYNLKHRVSEDVVNYCEKHQIAFIPWYPIASGGLTNQDTPLERIANLIKATPTQVALAWLLKRSKVMLPIPGTSSIKHLEENTAAASINLTNEEFAVLNDR